jgi:hypothetical protein
MKWIFSVLLLVFCCGPVFTQKQETRPLKPFSKIWVADRIIAILQSDTISEVVVAPQGDGWVEEVKTKVDGKELTIRSEGRFRESAIFCYVHYNGAITHLSTQFGGVIRTDSNQVFEGTQLKIEAVVDGFANLDIAVDELEISAGSGSDIHIRGKARKVIIRAISGAKVHLDDLECEDAEVTSSMGAKVWLTAKNNYKATAGTGGKIYYYAEPAGKFERSRITGGNVELIPR